MDFLLKMSRQPIFQFMAIMIILLITDVRPGWGIMVAIVLFLFVAALPFLKMYAVLEKFRQI